MIYCAFDDGYWKLAAYPVASTATSLPATLAYVMASPKNLGAVLRDSFGMHDDNNAFLPVNMAKQQTLAVLVELVSQEFRSVSPDGSVGPLIRRQGPPFAGLPLPQ